MRAALALLLLIGSFALPAGIEGVNRIQARQAQTIGIPF
jgi:hypothetical protein